MLVFRKILIKNDKKIVTTIYAKSLKFVVTSSTLKYLIKNENG